MSRKLTLAGLLALTLTTGPALAAPSIVDQVNSAFDAFLGNPNALNYYQNYPVALANGLTGTWFDGTDIPDGADLPDAISKACSQHPVKIDATDPFDLKMVRTVWNTPITVEFKAQGENLYQSFADPDAIIEAWKAAKSGTPEQNLQAALLSSRALNATFVMLRPSADILVAEKTYFGGPHLYGRCPAL